MNWNSPKGVQVVERVDALAERVDYLMSQRLAAPLVVRRADKTFDESKHPRGPDGKFVEGEGAAGAAAAEYLSQQAKAGKKATPNGMMQHLLLNGGITKQEIWDTTKANFEMSPSLNNYVSAVAATMKKKGIDVPEPPKAKKGGEAPPAKKEEPKAEDKPGMKESAVETWKTDILAAETPDQIAAYEEGIGHAKAKGHITLGQATSLTNALNAAKAKLVDKKSEAGGGLPKPQNTAEDDIAWMFNTASYSTEEKIKYLGEMKIAPKTQPYMDKALALLGAKPGSPVVPPPAADPELTTVQMTDPALPKPAPNATSNIHANLYKTATDKSLSTSEKIAELTEKYENFAGAHNKAYAAELIKALGGTPPAAPAKPPMLTMHDFSEPQKDMWQVANSTTKTAEQKSAELQFLAKQSGKAKDMAYAGKLMTELEQANPSPPKPAPKPIAATANLQSQLADLKQKWKGVTAINKPPIDALAQKLDKALGLPTDVEQKAALAAIEPIPNPIGMGQQSANEFLANAQTEAGLTPTAPGSTPQMPPTKTLPKGPGKKLQNEIFHKLEGAPAVYIETTAKFEGANGKIKARNVIDTDRIPAGEHAKITAAYGDDPSNAMTQAVDQAMEQYTTHSIKKLSEDTKHSIYHYQGFGYKAMNAALLGDGGGPATKAHINRIRKAIEDSAIPADTPAFRGLRASLADLAGFDDPAKAVGRAFVHKNFASVSRSQATSEAFGDKVLMKMTLPAGTPGLVMEGQHGDEREIMLNSNSVFRIDKVEQFVSHYGEAKHLVHVTYMGTKADD